MEQKTSETPKKPVDARPKCYCGYPAKQLGLTTMGVYRHMWVCQVKNCMYEEMDETTRRLTGPIKRPAGDDHSALAPDAKRLRVETDKLMARHAAELTRHRRELAAIAEAEERLFGEYQHQVARSTQQ
jgi:hypothetical protein